LEPATDSHSSSGTQQFILFVSGMSHKSGNAIENIRKLCDTYLANRYELQIVDISRDKQMAVDYQIIAIPTLIRIQPLPKRTILGDLSDTQKILQILDLEM